MSPHLEGTELKFRLRPSDSLVTAFFCYSSFLFKEDKVGRED